jgi:Fur family ferric uptake transcriptional regulator
MPHCQTYIKTLRNLGYRITPQREMIIEALAHSPHHITAEEVYAKVHERARAVNIATIYRTLELLVEQGMASRAGLQDGRVVYAASNHGSHLHLVCRACGNAINASQEILASLEEQLRQQYGFAADLQHLTIAGLCSDCLPH